MESHQEAQQLWRVELFVLAATDEMKDVRDRLAQAICGDDDHEGPCRNPWTMTTVGEASLRKKVVRQLRPELEPQGRTAARSAETRSRESDS